MKRVQSRMFRAIANPPPGINDEIIRAVLKMRRSLLSFFDAPYQDPKS